MPSDPASMVALLDRLESLSSRVAALEAHKPSNGSSMDFLQRHEGLSLRRPPSAQSLGALTHGVGDRGGGGADHHPVGLPRPASYTNLSHVEIPMPATRVVMTQIVTPADTIGAGICTGGTVLCWIDVAAGLAAKTLARAPVVTASVDAVHFLRPCRLQSIVTIAAMVNRVFASSMEVGVQVEEEDPATGVRHHCCSAYLTFVALSRRTAGDGAPPPPKKLPPKVIPTDGYHQEIFDAAAARREARLAARKRLNADPEAAAAEAACRLLPIAHRPTRATLEPSPLAVPTARRGLAAASAGGAALPAHATAAATLRPPPTRMFRTASVARLAEAARAAETVAAAAARSFEVGLGATARSAPPSPRTSTPPEVRGGTPLPPPRATIRPALAAAHMTQLIMPQHANSLGIAFGGGVMRWMEQCAFVAAARVARGAYLLTAAMDSIAFAAPTRVGDIMYIEAQVTAIFGSSVEVMISVWAETPEIGGLIECGDAYATIVSMNANAVPQDIPFELVPETAEDHTRYAGAIHRRTERLRMREAMRLNNHKRKALDGVSDRFGSTDDILSTALHTDSGDNSPRAGAGTDDRKRLCRRSASADALAVPEECRPASAQQHTPKRA